MTAAHQKGAVILEEAVFYRVKTLFQRCGRGMFFESFWTNSQRFANIAALNSVGGGKVELGVGPTSPNPRPSSGAFYLWLQSVQNYARGICFLHIEFRPQKSLFLLSCFDGKICGYEFRCCKDQRFWRKNTRKKDTPPLKFTLACFLPLQRWTQVKDYGCCDRLLVCHGWRKLFLLRWTVHFACRRT